MSIEWAIPSLFFCLNAEPLTALQKNKFGCSHMGVVINCEFHDIFSIRPSLQVITNVRQIDGEPSDMQSIAK